MGTKLSYDYSELLGELQSDIQEGLIEDFSNYAKKAMALSKRNEA